MFYTFAINLSKMISCSLVTGLVSRLNYFARPKKCLKLLLSLHNKGYIYCIKKVIINENQQCTVCKNGTCGCLNEALMRNVRRGRTCSVLRCRTFPRHDRIMQATADFLIFYRQRINHSVLRCTVLYL